MTQLDQLDLLRNPINYGSVLPKLPSSCKSWLAALPVAKDCSLTLKNSAHMHCQRSNIPIQFLPLTRFIPIPLFHI